MILPCYLWSNNACSQNTLITAPGTYWLVVRNSNNCTGRDTIIVNNKACLQGIYVPAAFTPNNDGNNDLFRPLLFGNIQQYPLLSIIDTGRLFFKQTIPMPVGTGAYIHQSRMLEPMFGPAVSNWLISQHKIERHRHFDAVTRVFSEAVF